jgi:hypothetical protein
VVSGNGHLINKEIHIMKNTLHTYNKKSSKQLRIGFIQTHPNIHCTLYLTFEFEEYCIKGISLRGRAFSKYFVNYNQAQREFSELGKAFSKPIGLRSKGD